MNLSAGGYSAQRWNNEKKGSASYAEPLLMRIYLLFEPSCDLACSSIPCGWIRLDAFNYLA